jgi:uncharacterized SAM-binding protein YcdF (DUF218 family)
MSRLSHRWRWFAVCAGAASALWLAGFVWFVVGSLSPGDDPTAQTDAIVVLTGGRLRLETGVDLFGEGKARKLFISGVNHRVDRGALMRVFAPIADRARCCIVLGHDADDTFGNARETASWMREQGFASLRLVTSWYHMRRSLLEFHRAMPEIRVVASPVFAERDEGEGGAEAWLAAAALTVGEYDKFLAVRLRLMAEQVWPGLPGLGPEDRPQTTANAAAARMQ